MRKALIFVEAKGEEPRKASLEVLSEGRKLSEAGQFYVEAVALGSVAEGVKRRTLAYVDRFVGITDEMLNVYSPQGFARALAAYAQKENASVIVGGATEMARDFFPRLAVRLGAGIASDVTWVGWDDDPITCIRPVFGGKALAKQTIIASPALLTIRPNTFPIAPPPERAGVYEERHAGLAPDQIQTRVLKVEEQPKGKVELMEADVVVAGGRGLKAAENFGPLEELARVLGGAVAASRSVVDAKWRDQDDQVGKSGKTVSPRLYIAAGISGAIHHVMGMDTSGVILAVNNDPNAVIFNYANYGIVGDALEIIPAMTEEFRKRAGK
jgi:electron transfer flavoprotein alpha subunit